MSRLYRALQGPLFALDAERAHGLSILGLRSGLPLVSPPSPDPRLRVRIAGLDFPNPVGMAAGYDKDAEVPDALLSLGFGFVEVGTIAPLPQPGNPKPRVFRLRHDNAVVNRLGFNTRGHAVAHRNLTERRSRKGIVGVNIGANKESSDRIADYAAGVTRFADVASYITINISSPNTVGLRDLQSRASLAELLSRVMEARAGSVRPDVPILLKIAPDLHEDDLADIAQECLDKRVDGIIVSNTTLSRQGATDRLAAETGGLSGRPLFERSTVMLARTRRLVGPDMPLIGVGGIDSAETAIAKITAGADLIQLYTGMIYQGPGIAADIVRGLSAYLDRRKLESLATIRDSRVDDWASHQL